MVESLQGQHSHLTSTIADRDLENDALKAEIEHSQQMYEELLRDIRDKEEKTEENIRNNRKIEEEKLHLLEKQSSLVLRQQKIEVDQIRDSAMKREIEHEQLRAIQVQHEKVQNDRISDLSVQIENLLVSRRLNLG